jgi:hypothetical protein
MSNRAQQQGSYKIYFSRTKSSRREEKTINGEM